MSLSKKHKRIKQSLQGLLALAAISAMPLSFAANTNPGVGSIVSAIKAATYSAAHAFYQSMYQYDKTLKGSEQANTATAGKTTINKAIKAQANAYTQYNIDNSLQQFSYAVTPPRRGTEAYKILEAYKNNNSTVRLSVGTKASDSLYANPLIKPYMAEKLGVARPTVLHNNYFNFDTLFSPLGYNEDQFTATQRYLQYLTQDYIPMTAGMDLSALKNEPPSIIKKFVDSSAWQTYLLKMRSMLAARSIVLSNLNYLVAERTPIKNLGENAGMPVSNASPLQVQKYIATRRANSKQWYQQLQKDSSATILREIASMLAEQEKQNFQQHLLRERMLVTLTALDLQAAKADQMMARAEGANVNAAINSAIGKSQSGQLSKSQQTQLKQYMKNHQNDNNNNTNWKKQQQEYNNQNNN